MCAFNAALDFGKDMLELSASTFGRLVAIQLSDLTTFLEHQSVAAYRIAEVQNVAGLLALQRDYGELFWKDRRAALTATTEALQAAARSAANSWTEWAGDRAAPAVPAETKPATRRAKRKPTTVAPVAAPIPISPAPTKTRSTRPKMAVIPLEAERNAAQEASPPAARKRSAGPKKGAGRTRSPPPTPR